MSHKVTALVAAAAALAAMLLAAPESHAEVSAGCAAHLASKPGETAASDRRYHLERGEESPCSGRDAYGWGESRSGDDDRDGKSRYCRKHWYC